MGIRGHRRSGIEGVVELMTTAVIQDLTPRQMEILQALADEGYAKLARRKLGMTHSTFWSHMSAIGERWGTSGSVQTIAEGFRRGLLR